MPVVPQIVPSKVCLSCDVCCRFPEPDSFLRPFFTQTEIQQAIEHGVDEKQFVNHEGAQIEVVPNPAGDGYLCPAFDLETSNCRIYEVRPLDCRLYPFALMWDDRHQEILLGWDTKCPFLSPTSPGLPFPREVSMLPVLPTLPAEMMGRARQLAAQLEDDEVWQCQIVQYPNLVTRFQDDVVVIQTLPRLTKAVSRENS